MSDSASSFARRNPVSSCLDIHPPDGEPQIPSIPSTDDPHDEYSLDSPSAADKYTTPSRQSDTSNKLSDEVHRGLNILCGELYGCTHWCHATLNKYLTEASHVVKCRSHNSLVCKHVPPTIIFSSSFQLTLYEYCLGFPWGTFHVDSRQNIFYRAESLTHCYPHDA